MTNGLVKERKTIFINGYAVQWFSNILKHTNIMIYANVPNHNFVFMTEIKLDYIADDFSVECIAKEKIAEIESL